MKQKMGLFGGLFDKKTCSLFSPDETQVQSAYACAQDFYSFMKSWRMAQKQRSGR